MCGCLVSRSPSSSETRATWAPSCPCQMFNNGFVIPLVLQSQAIAGQLPRRHHTHPGLLLPLSDVKNNCFALQLLRCNCRPAAQTAPHASWAPSCPWLVCLRRSRSLCSLKSTHPTAMPLPTAMRQTTHPRKGMHPYASLRSYAQGHASLRRYAGYAVGLSLTRPHNGMRPCVGRQVKILEQEPGLIGSILCLSD